MGSRYIELEAILLLKCRLQPLFALISRRWVKGMSKARYISVNCIALSCRGVNFHTCKTAAATVGFEEVRVHKRC